jgi:ankyrin repeat protein
VPPLALSLSLSLSSPHLSQDGQTPLFWACSKGHVNVAEMLLSTGASVDHQNNVSVAPRVSLMVSSIRMERLLSSLPATMAM